ncbi:MAG TPA: ribulokinase [Sediminibacterium sp.]|uniref:ribulokinase n=1 Tax=Sediminibacterium sp. TaxID=1917865 RepID=UPI0008B472E4|nr:ribulokinase [Sediminibacterium sp.]OHC84475.1 MAG: ribulokinase [Sphingobacteriia bacterium RIFOXYC2_FULL_35_18]OHC88989.1 MAG: ribulokinase [Sphingobacteriia bacterium RIFOXYD2_FULL_35_12]HLD53154.1 ribulokinase [Sediminibacterium sp.]
MKKETFVIGVDYGTDSVRSIIVNTTTGEEIATAVHHYARWKKGLYCNAAESVFRQHPLDYVEGLTETITNCLKQVGKLVAENIVAIGVDTTGSTPVAVDATGTPLALKEAFAENPNAMFVLWKDHTSVREAAEINQHATKFETNYLQYVGGIYSSEWFWAKLLHIIRNDDAVKQACVSWVEHCDWIPFMLTGGNNIKELKRSVCAAGHKGLWSEQFNGYPPNDFFTSLDPLLDGYVLTLGDTTYSSDKSAGTLSKEWASKLGLNENVVVAVGAFDAHMGAVGGQIEPYHLSKVMGTSTCDILVAPTADLEDKTVKGICGQVTGSVIPGMLGLEAGQSAFGDTYAWFKNMILSPIKEMIEHSDAIKHDEAEQLIKELSDQLITHLSNKAALLPLNEDDELALDWFNGRRTPDANQYLTGSIHQLNLGSTAPSIFKALVEATCFGAKRIVDRFISEGVPVNGLIGLGGVAKRSPYIMQVMADVMNMPIRIHKSEQTCALGAAMFAATAAGVYAKVEEAMKYMGQGFEGAYYPNESRKAYYEKRYSQYIVAGNFTENHAPNNK